MIFPFSYGFSYDWISDKIPPWRRIGGCPSLSQPVNLLDLDLWLDEIFPRATFFSSGLNPINPLETQRIPMAIFTERVNGVYGFFVMVLATIIRESSGFFHEQS